MEWIVGLDFEKVANAIVILLTGFLAAFGFRRGRSSPAQPSAARPHVEIAGALIDASSVKLLAGEIAGQTLAIAGQTKAARDGIEAIEELARALVQVKEQLAELRHEMRRD